MSHFKNKLKQKLARYFRRKHRVNVTIKSTHPEMRIIVNKSNKYVSAQAIAADWSVVAYVSDKSEKADTKTARAMQAGEAMAKKLAEKKIKKVAFDRNWHLYHGRVKSFADGLRQWGITL